MSRTSTDVTLVTGATGMVGSALVRHLISAGERVRILRRPASSADLLESAVDSVEHAIGDVTDPDSLPSAVDGVSRVYHCAALVDLGGPAAERRLHEVNAGGTANVVDAARDAGVERLVHVSSIAALGRTRDAGVVRDEDSTWTPSRENSAYARSKYAAELEVQRGVAEGLNAVIVNPALVFGRGRPGEGTMRIVERVARGRMAAAPPGGTCVVDADDIAIAMRAAMARGEAGRRYVLCGENLSWLEILSTLAEAFGRPAPRRIVSAAVMRTAAAAAETFAALTRTEPALTREQARAGASTHRYSSRRAIDELGVTFRPFSETARRLAGRA
jgi:dihydroflavonol-4-reductase